MRMYSFGSFVSDRLSLSGLLVVLAAAVGLGGAWIPDGGGSAEGPSATPVDDTLSAYTETVPGTLVEFDMVPVPAGSVTLDGSDAEVGPFWIGRLEVQWDAYDAYRLDEELDGLDESAVDAISLPSKPYGFGSEIPGFGQKEYPALAVTRNGAQHFARWISARTGHTYRLPTRAEWKHACMIAYENAAEWDAETLGSRAWFAGNADGEAHPVGDLEANELGMYDLLGNAAEHVVSEGASEDQPPEVWGGSYLSEADGVHCAARQQKTSEWQESDPQLPKSRWWLSDAPFVGVRLVRVPGS